jgi:Protein of unknown function (DUF2971)
VHFGAFPLRAVMEATLPAVVHGYHLMSADHALSSISLRRLKVARFSEANDPFELMALNCLRKDIRKNLTRFKNVQDANFGMLCFSEDWKSPVLWSHYADGHKGICLGFELRGEIGVAGPLHVVYEDEKLRALADDDFSVDAIPEHLQQLLHVVKFKHWAYEKEIRVLVELAKAQKERSHYFYSFSEEMVLKEIILGHLCSVTLLEPIRALAKAMHPGATVGKARLGYKYFEVKYHERYPPA